MLCALLLPSQSHGVGGGAHLMAESGLVPSGIAERRFAHNFLCVLPVALPPQLLLLWVGWLGGRVCCETMRRFAAVFVLHTWFLAPLADLWDGTGVAQNLRKTKAAHGGHNWRVFLSSHTHAEQCKYKKGISKVRQVKIPITLRTSFYKKKKKSLTDHRLGPFWWTIFRHFASSLSNGFIFV